MATNQKYSVLGTFTTVIVGTTSGLRNLANNARQISAEFDLTGSGNRFTLANFELKVAMAVAPTANLGFEFYLITAADGTNYEYGDASNDPPPTTLAGFFPLKNTTSIQRVTLRNIILPNAKWKAILINKSGQAVANTNDTDSIFSYATYNFENV